MNWKFWQRNRSKVDPDLPQEVREYYSAARRSRTSTVVGVWFFALVFTFILSGLVFLAGRFAYQRIFQGEPTPTPVITDNKERESQPETIQNQPTQPETSQVDDTVRSVGRDSSSQPVRTSNGRTPDTGPGDVVAVFIGATVLAFTAYEFLGRKQQTS